MKDGDFTVNNEIISCWIKGALSYLVKAGIVFVVAFIVFTIMTTETILTSNRLEKIEDDTYEKYKNIQSDYGVSAVLEIDGESVVCLGLEEILEYDNEYQSLLNIFEDKIWIDQGCILYAIAALAISPICIICIKNKGKRAACIVDISRLRKTSISIILSIIIGGISLYTAQHIGYYVNRQINIGKIEDLVVSHFYEWASDKDILGSVYLYKATDKSYDLEELNVYTVYFFDCAIYHDYYNRYLDRSIPTHVYIDKTGDVQLYLDGQLRGAVGSYHYDKENIELVRKLD